MTHARRTALLSVLLIAAIAVASPQASRVAYDESITVSTTAIGITSSLITDASGDSKIDGCLVSISGADVRMRYAGTDLTSAGNPTSSVGHLFLNGYVYVIESYRDAVRTRWIRAAGTDATLYVTCFKR